MGFFFFLERGGGGGGGSKGYPFVKKTKHAINYALLIFFLFDLMIKQSGRIFIGGLTF